LAPAPTVLWGKGHRTRLRTASTRLRGTTSARPTAPPPRFPHQKASLHFATHSYQIQDGLQAVGTLQGTRHSESGKPSRPELTFSPATPGRALICVPERVSERGPAGFSLGVFLRSGRPRGPAGSASPTPICSLASSTCTVCSAGTARPLRVQTSVDQVLRTVRLFGAPWGDVKSNFGRSGARAGSSGLDPLNTHLP
jgi:hypothetical protein